MAEEKTQTTTPAVAQNSDNRGSRGRGGNDRRRNDRAPEPPKEFEEVTINIDRVARVVKGGRRFRFKALVVVGNHKDKVGVGVAKGADVTAAITKAANKAKKNLITIPIVNETIPHEVEVKVTGAHVLMKPAAPGTGIIAGGVVRSIVGLTNVKNLISKSLGSTNKVNIAYATIEGLKSLVPKNQWLNYKAPLHAVKGEKTEAKAEKVGTKTVEKKAEKAPKKEAK